MSDNVAITPGSGATVAADLISGALHQRVKLSVGADGSASDAVGGAGAVSAAVQRVTLASDDPAVTDLAAIEVLLTAIETAVELIDNAISGTEMQVDVVAPLPAGTEHIGEVGGNTTLITVVPTITAGAYSAGDVVGGELTLTNAMRISSGSGVLHSLTLFDADNEGAAMEVIFFDANPAGTYTDNNAPTWDASDEGKFLGKVSIGTGDYITVNAMKMVSKTNIGLAVAANGAQHLYAIVVVTGTPTYGTTTDLTFRFGFLRD